MFAFPYYWVSDETVTETGKFLQYVYEKYGFSIYSALLDSHEWRMEHEARQRVIEDTFYPNEMKFVFRRNGKATKNLNLLKTEDVEIARMLISQGYTKSDLTVSKPAKKNFREDDLRNSDFKWDTI